MPTIALGVFGWRLLRQEELRLAEAAKSAQVERAGLVAENLTLFLEEARSGIISGLSEMPVGDARESLAAWSDANPLVHQSFVWRPHAGVIPPLDNSVPTSFLHRYQQLFSPRSHWEGKVEAFQRAVPLWEQATAAGEKAPRPENTPRQELKQIADEARLANIAQQRQAYANLRYSGMAAEAESAVAAPAAGAMDLGLERAMAKRMEEAPRVVSSGWIPFLDKKPLAAIAWVELQPGGEIRGAEVDLDSVTTRMLAVLPSEEPRGDLYHLVDQNGEFYSAASAGLSPAAIRLDLGPLLPGWQLVADSRATNSGGGRGFFLVSSLLLGVLLTAILSGGSLLLYQAHRHQVDARQKSSFVSNVSHELKTPLTTIRMYAELIGEGRVRDETKQRNYLDVIITESQRLTRLINNVLDFSRLEQARKQVQPQAVSLRSTITPILDAQEIRLRQAGLLLVRDFPADDPTVLADPDALEQAVLNLIDNAIKYAPSGEELLVEVKETERQVRIHFMDRGPGIDARQHHRLFKEFSRGDTSLTASQPGCGLGLNIARRLLRRAGGELTYAARPDGGACFTIALPAAVSKSETSKSSLA